MLNLIKSGKSGRNYQVIEEIEIDLKKFFKKSEDSLTSSIFERLLYLPTNIFWQILTKSIVDKELYQLQAELVSFEFWPRLSLLYNRHSLLLLFLLSSFSVSHF